MAFLTWLLPDVLSTRWLLAEPSHCHGCYTLIFPCSFPFVVGSFQTKSVSLCAELHSF